MKISTFLINRYFSHWEHRDPRFLCTADIEPYQLGEILALADEECQSLWQHLLLGYNATQGHPLLRAEIASLYKGVQPEEILVFAGGEEAIFVLLNVLLQPGDHAIVVSPAYQSLYEVSRAAQADVTFLPLLAAANWTLDLEALRAAVRLNTRVIVANFPNAPTGALPDYDTFLSVSRIAQEAGAYLFCDESFRFLEYNQSDRLPAAVECYTKGLSLGSMSKAFGLAGLRIGWLVTHEQDLLQQMLSFKDYTSVSSSATSEILALIGLRAREAVLKRSLEIIAHNLLSLDDFFSTWSDVFSWVRPRAGSTAFPLLCKDIAIEQFASELVEQEGVLVLPGTVYEHPGNHFRIGFGRTDLPDALVRLERFTANRFRL